ncbi:S8 family serine peptidase [Ornithinimicrobium cerasi]|uniref:S8 family serine peptidase n=1 Tax=Ornithinimicrobium cerasi TaxID=2248773 RepID=UPI000EFF7ACB|nr:S8 family serine peptidase [Ornithinimicrobium cerasi]
MIESGPAPEIVLTEHGPSLTTPPQTTGRFVVVLAEGAGAPAQILLDAAGVGVRPSAEMGDGDETVSEDTVFEELGIAVVSADPDQLGALQTAAATDGTILSVSPELIHHVMADDYVRGYADGVADLAHRLGVPPSDRPAAGPGTAPAAPRVPIFRDTADHTWGVEAVEAHLSDFSGQGVAVAVLDTGFDSGHPDFAGRSVTVRSFVPGESAQDGHGHGTHCIGTALGPVAPAGGPRYGVAHRADIFAGKVLSNGGSGSDAGILAGIEWAIRSGCAIVSMSLGADVPRIHPPYVAAGRRALDKGVLIIAAAGNNAQRLQHNYGFVGTPANSPSVLAVGALTQQLDVAYFSARTLTTVRGGQVDLAGPGYQVYSSWPMPTRYRTISGTSMATPHVAGVAALWAEATGFRGRELWATLVEHSLRLAAPSLDVGSGLATSP